MATKYVQADNTAWVDSGVTGPMKITSKAGEMLLYFGTLIPATYADGPHHHICVDDVNPFEYNGTEKLFVRSHNNVTAGIKQKSKVAVTNG